MLHSLIGALLVALLLDGAALSALGAEIEDVSFSDRREVRGVELVLNACNINLVAFNRYHGGSLDGQIAALFVIALAAAEAAVAVAICVNFYKNLSTVDVDRGDTLRG